MKEIWIPFQYENTKEEIKPFYLSFLCRVFVIKWQEFYNPKITKQSFCEAMTKQGWNKKRINRVWQYWKAGNYLNYICSDYLILRWKEKVIWDKWFLIKADPNCDIWFYSFCSFITEMYSIRPVKQTADFYEEFKFKNKATKYNEEITRRSFAKKISRWQRKISEQSWCCLKTVNNRLKKSKTIKTLKRYDSYNWFRVNKTNLYFSNKDISFFKYYSEDNNNKRLFSKSTIKSKYTALVNKTALFLNNCLSLNKLYNIHYEVIQKL